MNHLRHALAAVPALLVALSVVVAGAVGFERTGHTAPGAAPAAVGQHLAPTGAVADPAVDGAAAGGERALATLESSPHATRELLQRVIPPRRDEADLVRRFKHSCAVAPAVPVPLSRTDAEGHSRPFWVLDEPNRTFLPVQATLRYASPHLLFYVQDGVEVNRERLAASAAVFEETTYPILRRYFGETPEPPRITIFNGRVPGVGGYFSSSDMLPQTVNPFSNERPIVFMNLDATRPGTAAYDAVLAHEIQHFIHWAVHPQQDSWINEGASQLAMALSGYDQSAVARIYLARPETQLNAWAERPSEAAAHYGAGYLILEYFAQRMGGYHHVRDLIASPGTSISTFESYFDRRYSPIRFDDLFRDFIVANLLNDRSLADGRYGHERVAYQARVQESLAGLPATSAGSVRPYATRYVELLPAAGAAGGDLSLRFSGRPHARLYASEPRSGVHQWWGNAVDDMSSSLTREVDLAGVERATLRFHTWFDIEPDYDYAGVAVSTDGGCSWRTLPGRYTTDANPVGQNLGHGFTGRSAPLAAAAGVATPDGWVEEEMDLTPYAGQAILLRFFYVTDQSYHASGFVVDDVTIAEIGLHDDAEADAGWDTQGFLRSLNAAAVEWAVQVVAFTPGGPRIMRVPVAPAEGGALEGTLVVPGFGNAVTRVVVAVSPLVPVTIEPVDYRIDASMR